MSSDVYFVMYVKLDLALLALSADRRDRRE